MLELINKSLWSLAIILIVINSIYFSMKLNFPQLKLINAYKSLKNSTKTNSISPIDTLVMALSSKIGVGSLSGVAICIFYGGIGTIFWLLLSPFFLSIITYIENALSIIYKDEKENRSGPSYYIEKGMKNKLLALIYAALIIFCYIFLFTSIQTNTITVLTNNIYSTNELVVSLLIATLAGLTIVRGIKSISNICNKIFPAMMIVFLSIGFMIIAKNINLLPELFLDITKEAFNFKSASGGFFYTIIIAIQRSVFACESGVGTSAIISGSTDSYDYKTQANIGLIQTYFINIVVMITTALIIVTAKIEYGSLINGIELTKKAFFYHFGPLGELFLLVILILFSFSTIITIYYYGESSLKYITENTLFLKILKAFAILAIFMGGIINAVLIWNILDISLALLTIINMYAIYKLRKKIIVKLKKMI